LESSSIMGCKWARKLVEKINNEVEKKLEK